MNDQQHDALVNASDAVEAAETSAEAASAREARNALIIKIYREITERYPGRYHNRYGPNAINQIVTATGLNRVHVSRIVNDTPVVRGKRKSSDGSQDSN